MEDIMSPRLDASHTHQATSTSPPEHLNPIEQDSEDDVLAGLPEIPPFEEVGAMDARALSKTLFARLESLEEGTHEYSYVRNTLVELNLALVKFAASRFRSRSEPMEDIIQVGTIGLIKAIDRFELSRGVEFPTFAMPTIVGISQMHVSRLLSRTLVRLRKGLTIEE
jgi:RNA polymerase sigma-B factor